MGNMWSTETKREPLLLETRLRTDVKAQAAILQVTSPHIVFEKDDLVVIHGRGKLEVRRIAKVTDKGTIELDEPLANAYEAWSTIAKVTDKGLDRHQLEIMHARNLMYHEGRKSRRCRGKVYETVLFTRIMDPMLEHASATIYAPDMTIQKLYRAMCQRGLSNRAQTNHGCEGIANFVCTWVIKNRFFCLLVLACGVAFKLYGHQLTCLFKTTFLEWALFNQKLDPWMRYLSISGMMVLRMVVSNVFPFTSPAFAYLIATSQPRGQEWQGTFYLLACSMPAGLVVPFFDWLLYWVFRPWRSKDLIENDEEPSDYEVKKGARQFDHHFHCTMVCSKMTDHLPFSFWVRPVIMEPAFRAFTRTQAESKSACAVAVLAGHFMIWAGPATTMNQRLFVPDWVTCAFVQPLGLLEDVAVVLAAWAGSSDETEKAAEISLYFFMFYMNLVYFATSFVSHGCPNKRVIVQHFIVGVLTLIAVAMRLSLGDNGSVIYLVAPHSSSTTLTTTVGNDVSNACGPSVHSDVKVAGMLIIWVSFLAVCMRSVARGITFFCSPEQPENDGEGDGEALVKLSSVQRIGFRTLLLLSGLLLLTLGSTVGEEN